MQNKALKGLDEYVEIRYITPSDARFELTPGGFVSLRIGADESYSRVNLHRAFPLSGAMEFISVRDTDSKEIGMIRSLHAFPAHTVVLLEEEINRRYFTPVIQSIKTIKEEFGYSYWDVQTDSGVVRFSVRSGHDSIVELGDSRVMITDVDGNRYEIMDISKLDEKSYKKLQIFL